MKAGLCCFLLPIDFCYWLSFAGFIRLCMLSLSLWVIFFYALVSIGDYFLGLVLALTFSAKGMGGGGHLVLDRHVPFW